MGFQCSFGSEVRIKFCRACLRTSESITGRTGQPQNDIFRIIYFGPSAGRYRLDAALPRPHALRRQSAGRPLPLWPKGCGGGKSGLHRHTVPDNFRRGQPQGQCHRERTASSPEEARVKRCGKSAPRVRRRNRHGKPHREQDRIGTAPRAVRESDNAAGLCQARRPGRLLEATCKRCPRGMAVTYRLALSEAMPYRTRLTGWLML